MASAPARRCSACGAENASAARYCSQCSKPLESSTQVVASGAERKQVTVLFSDLSGYTSLAERLDPEDTRQIMARVFGCASNVVARYEGRIEKFIGDAIMAIFGVPVAHEDDPVRAVRAALELHEAIARLSPEVEARGAPPIALHSGINTGVVVTGELQFGRGTTGPLGDTVNLAARLMNAAPKGDIWVGPETRRLAGPVFEFDDVGTQNFKGKAQPVAVFRVQRPRTRGDAAASHFRGAFVGRQAEVGALLGAAEKMRDGEARVVGVRGDAGTGKTRLMSEFRARVGADVQWLEGRAYPYAQSIPYAPLIDLLSRAWGIEETDRPAQVRAKLDAGVSVVLDAPGETLPLLRHLYHLEQDAEVIIERESYPERLLAALRALLSALARRAPTVVCLQDLHWADESTATLLRGLITELPCPVLIAGIFRPGYTPPAEMQVIELSELSPRQTRDLLASLLQAEPPEALTQFIAERSDGNPFYVEEVVNSLIETQLLVRASEGWRLARPLAEAGIPPTVRGVIAARIDRLDDVRRSVLRHAAVVGREFLYAIVEQVCEQADDVALSLTQLQAVDLIRERRFEPELEYMFKHALTQDVAYEGLLKAERQVLHARTARVMEAVFVDRVSEFVETLAYHYVRGGVVDKAVYYLIEAGKKCVARYALVEAARHFRDAYALASGRDAISARSRALTELLNAWSHVHYYAGTIGEWSLLLEKHVPDAEGCGDAAMLSMYLGWLGLVRAFHGNFQGSIENLDRALEVGQLAGAREAVAHVTAWRSYTLFAIGRVAESIQSANSLDQSEAERRSAPYPYFKAQSALAAALAWSGDLGRAREVAEKLIRFGRTSGSARAEALGQFALANHWIMALDFERADAESAIGVTAARDPLYRAMNVMIQSNARTASLRAASALEVCNEWLPYLERNENYWSGYSIDQTRAAATMMCGDLSDGMRRYLSGIGKARAKGFAIGATSSEVYLMLIYISVVRMDVKPSFNALVRNPWFVITQAPFAARKARALIERLRTELPAKNLAGYLNLVDLCDARLCVYHGRMVDARECLERIRRRLADAGLVELPAPVRELAGEIEGLRLSA